MTTLLSMRWKHGWQLLLQRLTSFCPTSSGVPVVTPRTNSKHWSFSPARPMMCVIFKHGITLFMPNGCVKCISLSVRKRYVPISPCRACSTACSRLSTGCFLFELNPLHCHSCGMSRLPFTTLWMRPGRGGAPFTLIFSREPISGVALGWQTQLIDVDCLMGVYKHPWHFWCATSRRQWTVSRPY